MSRLMLPFHSGALAMAAGLVVTGTRAGAGEEALTLGEAVQRALQHSPELAMAAASEAESTALTREAKAAFHPEASLGTSPGYGQGLPGGGDGRLPAIATLQIRESLYDASRRADIFEASARRAMSRGDLARAREDVLRRVVLAYWRCWADAGFIAQAREREGVYGRARQRAEALQGEGRASVVDVERAALQEAQARQVRLDRESDQELDELQLRREVGWAPDAPLELAGDPVRLLPVPEAADPLAMARDRDAQSAAAAEAARALAQAARLRGRQWSPVVDAAVQYSRLVRYGEYDQYYRTFRADDWSVGLSVVVPLWTGGRGAAASARAQAASERLRQQGRARESELPLLVRRTELQLERAVARAALARRAEALAQEDVRVDRSLAAEGRGGPAEVDGRVSALADARDEVLRADGEVVAARVEVLILRGDLPKAVLAASSP